MGRNGTAEGPLRSEQWLRKSKPWKYLNLWTQEEANGCKFPFQVLAVSLSHSGKWGKCPWNSSCALSKTFFCCQVDSPFSFQMFQTKWNHLYKCWCSYLMEYYSDTVTEKYFKHRKSFIIHTVLNTNFYMKLHPQYNLCYLYVYTYPQRQYWKGIYTDVNSDYLWLIGCFLFLIFVKIYFAWASITFFNQT